jgi:choline dehydrogenase-like flavoprotein
MNFVVGAKEDFDSWAELGNPGWNWDDFSKYLNQTYTVTAGAKTQNNGAIQTNIPDEETKWPQLWRDTLSGLGYPSDNNPFSGEIHGAVMYPDAIHPETRTRSYAGNAYLAPARDRPNLTVWTGVTVDKILFDKSAQDAVATGVQYTRDGQTSTVTAGKEVILSAGVFHSPKILEQSGIGDAKLLETLGIDVVVDNPHVGENLQHHPLSIMSFEVVDSDEPGLETIDAIARQDPAALSAATEAYTTRRRGPFSQTNCNTMAHLPLPGISTPSGPREAQHLLSQFTTTSPNPENASSNNKSTAAYTATATALAHKTLTSPTTPSGYYVFIPVRAYPGPEGRMIPAPSSSSTTSSSERYISVAVLLTRPLSRGSVHITGAAPSSELAIDPRYLSHPLDVEVLTRHVRFIESTLVKAEPLAGMLKAGGKRTPEGWPAGFSSPSSKEGEEGGLEEVKRFLRETGVASTLYAGTCSMMPREMGGVVDASLRVYGTGNVRVVDASVMPFITRGDTMATVYGIAEKAADLIKGAC